jgi:glycosyltransferase involved in cell wall biosynthesis
MNNNPLVSVITTFLNAEKFIEESIQSVISQSYQNWELLLVDDGSNDASTTIALKYVKQYPDKVYCLEHQDHKNKGISASRNLGIMNAKGKYIATIDADDIWVPKKLEEQVSILESNPEVGMVHGNSVYWYSWTGKPLDKERDSNAHDLIKPNAVELHTVVKPPRLLNLLLSYGIPSPSLSNIMFRKNVAEDIGGFEEVFTGMHEDQAFLAKAYLYTPVYVSSECWDFYRMHEDSCVSIAENEGRFLSAELFYLDWLKNYISKNDFKNSDVLLALRRRSLKHKHPNLFELSNLYRKVRRKFLNVIKRI